MLLITAVGGVVLGRRRGGLDEDEGRRDRLTPLDILRPRGTGTMVEGVEGLALAHVRGLGNELEDAAARRCPTPIFSAALGGWSIIP